MAFVFENLISVIEEAVKNGETVSFSPAGRSMLPTIRENLDSVTISPAETIKKYDIVMYRRANKKIVLHRVVIAEDNYYVMCGDHQFQLEYPIFKSQIIGKVSAIKRKNRITDLESPGVFYRLYVRLWDLRLILDKVLYYLIKAKRNLFK